MNVNYQKKMKEIISKLDFRPKLLLHSCCAPCSSAVIEKLLTHFDITVYYYNPNIEPFDEYKKRAEEQKRFIEISRGKNPIAFVEETYDNEEYKKIAKGLENEPEGGARCHKCYALRLEKTASYAKDNGFDYFCTTLSVSPYKNAAKLNEIGAFFAEKYGVPYLYSDFKKNDGYKRSIELSKEYNLYRQEYCGCRFSKEQAEKRKIQVK